MYQSPSMLRMACSLFLSSLGVVVERGVRVNTFLFFSSGVRGINRGHTTIQAVSHHSIVG